eukprot:Rhum_TRINITY_DN2283_c0_g1::Rhum_TRINITY_DN2283_c0_g1_i1::g.6639::m.6639
MSALSQAARLSSVASPSPATRHRAPRLPLLSLRRAAATLAVASVLSVCSADASTNVADPASATTGGAATGDSCSVLPASDVFVRYKFECPEGYDRLHAVHNNNPAQECEQAAAYLNVLHRDYKLLPGEPAKDSNNLPNGNDGCFLNVSAAVPTLHYIEPLQKVNADKTTSYFASSSSDVWLICKRVGGWASTKPSDKAPSHPPFNLSELQEAVRGANAAVHCEGGGSHDGVILICVCILAYVILGLPVVLWLLLKTRLSQHLLAPKHSSLCNDSMDGRMTSVSHHQPNPRSPLAVSHEHAPVSYSKALPAEGEVTSPSAARRATMIKTASVPRLAPAASFDEAGKETSLAEHQQGSYPRLLSPTGAPPSNSSAGTVNSTNSSFSVARHTAYQDMSRGPAASRVKPAS